MSYDNIRIEKSLYTTGKSFTQALEALDPSENYKGTSLEGLDAYERQLKRFDIKVSGENCDTVSKFFQTSDSAALFPEFVSRSIKLGMREACTVDKIIATTSYIDSLDYRSISLEDTTDLVDFINVAEGSAFSDVKITVKDKLTKLKKYGKMISASYEAIKFQKLDLFSITLRRIGENMVYYEAYDALATIDKPTVNKITYTGETFTYDNLIDIYTMMKPYNLTTILVDPKSFARLLKLPEMRDANAGLDFQATGRMITPLGASLLHTPELEGGKIIGLDKNCALEMVQAGGVVTDYDKLIDRQLERAAVTCTAGFSKIFTEASKVMSC